MRAKHLRARKEGVGRNLEGESECLQATLHTLEGGGKVQPKHKCLKVFFSFFFTKFFKSFISETLTRFMCIYVSFGIKWDFHFGQPPF